MCGIQARIRDPFFFRIHDIRDTMITRHLSTHDKRENIERLTPWTMASLTSQLREPCHGPVLSAPLARIHERFIVTKRTQSTRGRCVPTGSYSCRHPAAIPRTSSPGPNLPPCEPLRFSPPSPVQAGATRATALPRGTRSLAPSTSASGMLEGASSLRSLLRRILRHALLKAPNEK